MWRQEGRALWYFIPSLTSQTWMQQIITKNVNLNIQSISSMEIKLEKSISDCPCKVCAHADYVFVLKLLKLCSCRLMSEVLTSSKWYIQSTLVTLVPGCLTQLIKLRNILTAVLSGVYNNSDLLARQVIATGGNSC